MLGPGILYAATAIGVSHIVQSTRAGAVYGLAMLAIVMLVSLVKYPAIRFGSQYSAATGKSLPENYLEQGWWAAAFYIVGFVVSIWFVLAAVAITTSGLVQTVFRLDIGAVPLAGLLLALTGAMLVAGRYRWLERAGKVLVALLAVLVVLATALVIPAVDWRPGSFALATFDASLLFFVVAMAGWMPTPVDGSILNSIWTSARIREEGLTISPRASRIDFDVGYGTAVLLALGFVILGVGVLHQNQVPLETSPAGFAAQVIELFTRTVGDWSYYLIGAAAIAALFSTLLALMDGMPRQLLYVTQRFRSTPHPAWLYPAIIVAYGAGTYLTLATLLTSFARFIDLTTSLGFVLAPVYAILNHRAMTGAEVPEAYRPGPALRAWSLAGIVVLTATSAAFFYLQLTG